MRVLEEQFRRAVPARDHVVREVGGLLLLVDGAREAEVADAQV